MRHRVAGKQLSRTTGHRQALRRNLAASLFEHGAIMTTKQKAQFVRPFAEKLITLAKKGTLHARRQAIALLQDRDICKVENDEPVKQTTVINKLFSEIAPRFQERPGGYTRIVRLPLRRVGDNGEQVLLQLVEEQLTRREPRKRRKAQTAPAGPKTAQKPAEAPADVAPETEPTPEKTE
jgi:large subunit ribosomal protein L17